MVKFSCDGMFLRAVKLQKNYIILLRIKLFNCDSEEVPYEKTEKQKRFHSYNKKDLHSRRLVDLALQIHLKKIH